MNFFSYLLLIFFIVVTINAGIYVGNFPIKNPLLRRLGYRCDTQMGPMKAYEKRSTLGVCVSAFCSESGFVSYRSCISIPSFCTRIPGHAYRPFPKCCHSFTCNFPKIKNDTIK